MTYDVVIVGAGPGGASTATFLARRGVSTLLLDRATFPRDKVCGDGLTPQAIHWVDRLGCADEVLAATNSCVKRCDLYINGEYLLTGGFPDGTMYPDFAVLLDRRRFDDILVRNAIARGARFESERLVRGIEHERDCVRVLAEADGRAVEYRGRIVIGADGVSSVVSRAIGNTLKSGATAVSLRTYYRNVRHRGSPIKVYFDRRFFPGYGWIFVDDGGFANVGVGYAFDTTFPMLDGLRVVFQEFVDTQLADILRDADQCGAVSGGAASFYRPKAMVADRVMLVGDAANRADPLNGGGIHKAMESGFVAAEAAMHALSVGEFSRETLRRYETMWSAEFETDWRTAELLLSIAKNPDLKDFCLFLLTQIGRLTTQDAQFRDFCSGVFSGVVSQSACLSPVALYHALPRNPDAWLALLDSGDGPVRGSTRLAVRALASVASAGLGLGLSPVRTVGWGMEVATKAVQLAEHRLVAALDTRPRGILRAAEG
jgi:geranylgeranyl reductase family protein